VPDSFSAPMRSTAPAGSPADYTDPKSIDALLKSSDPEAVAASGRSYQKFAAAYEKIAGELLSLRTDLHDAWAGEDAAVAAQSQLREVWSAAATVHKTASTFGVTIERHGSEHLAWYKYNKPPSKDLPEAQSWMTGANERVTQAWSSLPPDLSTSLLPGEERDHAELWRSGSASASGAGVSTSDSSGGAGGLDDGGASTPLHQPTHDGAMPADTTDTGTSLAGLPGVGSPAGGTGTLPGVLGGFPAEGGLGPVISGGGTPLGLGVTGPGVIGATPGLVGGSGRLLSGETVAEEARAAGTGRTGRPDLMGLPGNTAADDRERERARRSWMAEDKELWTGDVHAAPQVVGAEVTQQSDRAPLEIDLSGDDDLITDLLEELNDDGPQDPQAEIAELRAKLARLEKRAAVREEPMSDEPDVPAAGGIIGDDG
jgi:hypothetical protein